MLRYTGHPFVDVGAATIAAFVNKRDPTKVTKSDLEKVAGFITRQYVIDPLKSFLTVAFTSNSGYSQPAYEKTPQKRIEYARKILAGVRDDIPLLEDRCVFTGEPVTAIPYTDKHPPGRAFRQHIPLIMGEGIINFYPGGDAGLPVSGEAMLCIQAFPLGCAKCGGKLLAIHSDDADLTYEFAREFLDRNRRSLELAQTSGSKKMPEAKYSARTLLIDTLLLVEQRRRDASDELKRPCSVTAYHISNSGQSPSLDIYHLPLEMTDFLYHVSGPDYRNEWNAIVQRAWQLSHPKRKARGADNTTSNEDVGPSRNMLYEDLFKLPLNARTFLQTYFLRIAWRYARDDDPRGTYSVKSEAELVSWKLTELFLRKVMCVEKDRIQEIRDLGDRLAVYVSEENDKRFFRTFFSEQRYDFFRTALIKANVAWVRNGRQPLITFDQFMKVFEEGEEIDRPDWRLARDLVLIRMVEGLYRQGWLGRNQDAIPEITVEETA